MKVNDKYPKIYQHKNNHHNKFIIIIVYLWQFSFKTDKKDRTQSEKTRCYWRFRALFDGT